MGRFFVTDWKTVAAVTGLTAVAIVSSGCNKLKARDNLNKGVNAFRSGQYTAAADAFKTAIDYLADTKIQGPVVEFGTCTGFTARLIAELLSQRRIDTSIHLFDTFEGFTPRAGRIRGRRSSF